LGAIVKLTLKIHYKSDKFIKVVYVL